MRTEKPRLLMVFYGNPDYYAAVCREAGAISEHFTIHFVAVNDGRAPAFEWPADITVERVGPRAPLMSAANLVRRLVHIAVFARFVRIVRKRVRELAPSVVYAYDTRAFAAGLAARRQGDFALVFHWHDLIDIEQLSRLSPQRWIEKQATAKGPSAELIVADDPGRLEHYGRQSGDNRPTVLLPNYPSLKLFPRPPDFETLVRRRFERREILYTGGVGGGGNASAALIRACAQLHPDCRLTLFGPSDPASVRELDSLADSLSLAGRFSYRGWIPWRQLMACTTEATIGVVTFRPISFNYTAMGAATNKLYEYAARGLPVVVPDTPSFREALKGERWAAFADIDDPEAVAHGLRWFLDNRDRYVAAALAARQAFEQRLNFECVFPRLLERLLPLAQRGNRRSGDRPN